jgi:hypothetical protein
VLLKLSFFGFAVSMHLREYPVDAIADWLEQRKFSLDLQQTKAFLSRAALEAQQALSESRLHGA